MVDGVVAPVPLLLLNNSVTPAYENTVVPEQETRPIEKRRREQLAEGSRTRVRVAEAPRASSA